MQYFKLTYDIYEPFEISTFGVLSDIRWVVNNVLVSRRMDTQNKYKARLPPESLRYTLNQLNHAFM